MQNYLTLACSTLQISVNAIEESCYTRAELFETVEYAHVFKSYFPNHIIDGEYEGWRIATFKEGKLLATRIWKAMEQWDISIFSNGKIAGPGYGWNLAEGPHIGCTYAGGLILIPDDGCGPDPDTIDWETCTS